MTPTMMAPATHRQLSELDLQSKQELLAFIRNRLTVLSGSAQMIAHDTTSEVLAAKARLIVRDTTRLLKELETLLQIQREAVR